MYSDNLVIKLNTIAHQYKELIAQSINKVLREPKYINTGESAASVTVSVIDGDNNKAPQVVIHYNDSLNVLNSRKPQWTKQPPIKELIQWAETKTFSGPVPGYKGASAAALSPEKRAIRVAWAIAKSQQNFDKWKTKPWRKKSLSAVLKEMNQQILISFDKAIDEDLQQAINKGLNG